MRCRGVGHCALLRVGRKPAGPRALTSIIRFAEIVTSC
ncbi:hypothetical protein Salmuc_03110 [Salipiger mucosus DSM 16094]|uniref:Uncharacterized protein n=1 Tax=Salipiger mucosus DSM 16094 TaxID=1123237 RepID=S9Q877_9RHOB|nr:hypothetical protein Salmuc_03110 [Salipiger mucosus DSM 16094]